MDEELNCPSDVAVLPDGSLAIVDRKNDRIMKWKVGDTCGVPLVGVKAYGPGFRKLLKPEAVLCLSDGSLVISDTGHQVVLLYNSTKNENNIVEVAGEHGKVGWHTTHLNYPRSIAVDKNDTLYIVDAFVSTNSVQTSVKL